VVCDCVEPAARHVLERSRHVHVREGPERVGIPRLVLHMARTVRVCSCWYGSGTTATSLVSETERSHLWSLVLTEVYVTVVASRYVSAVRPSGRASPHRHRHTGAQNKKPISRYSRVQDSIKSKQVRSVHTFEHRELLSIGIVEAHSRDSHTRSRCRSTSCAHTSVRTSTGFDGCTVYVS
jgi:hypothetical protein